MATARPSTWWSAGRRAGSRRRRPRASEQVHRDAVLQGDHDRRQPRQPLRAAGARLRLHLPTHPEPYVGPDGFKDLVTMLHGCFPDFYIHAKDMVASGDMVVTRWRGGGTHLGGAIHTVAGRRPAERALLRDRRHELAPLQRRQDRRGHRPRGHDRHVPAARRHAQPAHGDDARRRTWQTARRFLEELLNQGASRSWTSC
jgi:hypothetical protein